MQCIILGERGLDYSGSRYRLVAGSCERGNKPLDFIKCGVIFNFRDTSAGIVSRVSVGHLRNRGSIPRRGKRFTLALDRAQSPVRWITRT